MNYLVATREKQSKNLPRFKLQYFAKLTSCTSTICFLVSVLCTEIIHSTTGQVGSRKAKSEQQTNLQILRHLEQQLLAAMNLVTYLARIIIDAKYRDCQLCDVMMRKTTTPNNHTTPTSPRLHPMMYYNMCYC